VREHSGVRFRSVILARVSIGLGILLAATLSAWAQPDPRGPYLQSGTPTSIVVKWRTGTASVGRVRYGPAPGQLVNFVDEPQASFTHQVILQGLAPDTRYYYSVGSGTEIIAGDDLAHFFRTSPPPGTRRPIRVWVLGDSGTADVNARAVRDAYESSTGPATTDVWLMLGDNAYTGGTDGQYQAAVFDMYPGFLRRTVLWPTFGNHEAPSASSATQSGTYYDIFTLPTAGEAGGIASGTEAYYSFDYGNVHFVCLNSEDVDRSPGGAMLTWLEQDLATTSADWVVAYFHHPPHSHGSHNSDNPSDSGGRMTEMRENVAPILEDHGVDLVLTGHSHNYERSFLLDGHYGTSSTLTGAMILDAGDGRIEGDGAYRQDGSGSHEGTVYVVAGSSGQATGGSLDHPAMYTGHNLLGSVVLSIDGDRLDAVFLDDLGVERDYFTILRGSVPPPEPPTAPTNLHVVQ
jgi:hypothetical protein